MEPSQDFVDGSTEGRQRLRAGDFFFMIEKTHLLFQDKRDFDRSEIQYKQEISAVFLTERKFRIAAVRLDEFRKRGQDAGVS